jgi:hypothetical protein
MKRILVERDEVSRIARLFEYSGQAVRNALRGFVDSEQGRRIREEALRAGGVEKPNRRLVRTGIGEQ